MVYVSYVSTLANFLETFDPFNTDCGVLNPRNSCAQTVLDFAQCDFLQIEEG